MSPGSHWKQPVYSYGVEILRNALNKTYNRIYDLRKEITHLKKSVVKAEQFAAIAKAEVDGAESKLMLVDGEPVVGENPARMKRLRSTAEKTKENEVSTRESLESKEALLARALEENQALFLSLYKNFATVMSERLHETFGEKKLDHASEAMAVDGEDTTAMETDKDNGNSKRNVIGEKEQWCLSTLGYVKAFSRQYASEIWPHMDKLEVEVITESVHPLFRKAVYSGLRLHASE